MVRAQLTTAGGGANGAHASRGMPRCAFSSAPQPSSTSIRAMPATHLQHWHARQGSGVNPPVRLRAFAVCGEGVGRHLPAAVEARVSQPLTASSAHPRQSIPGQDSSRARAPCGNRLPPAPGPPHQMLRLLQLPQPAAAHADRLNACMGAAGCRGSFPLMLLSHRKPQSLRAAPTAPFSLK